MALSIKHEEADQLARKLAALTNTSITEAVVDALRVRVNEIENSKEKIAQEIMDMVKGNREWMIKNDCLISSTDMSDIYGEDGLPK